jgi:hypothetical protein
MKVDMGQGLWIQDEMLYHRDYRSARWCERVRVQSASLRDLDVLVSYYGQES